jgi:hypothetical protein
MNLTELDRPIIGGLRISLQEIQSGTTESKSRIKIDSGIVGTFAYYPIGVESQCEYKISPMISVQEINASPIESDNFPLNLIPNFLPLINKGPLQITTQVSNDGNIFLETVSNIEISKSGLFAGSDGQVLFKYQGDKILLTPGQKNNNTFSVTDRLILSNISVDPLPSFGIFRVTVNLSGSIGNKEFSNISESKLVIIFPWKILLIAVFALLIIFLYRRKSISEVLKWKSNLLNRGKVFTDSFQEINSTREKELSEAMEILIRKAEAKAVKVKAQQKIIAKAKATEKKINTKRVKGKTTVKGKTLKKTTTVKPKSPAGHKKP